VWRNMVLLALGLVAISFTRGASADAPELDCAAARSVSEDARGIAVLVVHRGDLVCEALADGIDPADSWELASGVKSFTAVMAAAAVQDGLLTLDEPVADTLTEWRGDAQRERVTIRHLLGQTSGLDINRRARWIHGYADAIETRIDHEPGTRFEYGAEHFQVFGEVLRRKLAAAGLDETPAHYFQRRVLGPIGARVVRWGAVDGMPVLSENAATDPLSWARFGHLVLEGGRWGDTQLLDGDTLTELVTPGPVNPVYGLGWWLPHPDNAAHLPRRARTARLDTMAAGPDFPDLWMAAGAGGQRLYILPELDLVVVRMTRGVQQDPRSRETRFSDRDFLEALLGIADDEAS